MSARAASGGPTRSCSRGSAASYEKPAQPVYGIARARTVPSAVGFVSATRPATKERIAAASTGDARLPRGEPRFDRSVRSPRPRRADGQVGAHRELVSPGRVVVDAHHLVRDAVTLDDARRTGRAVDLHRFAKTTRPILVREAWRRRPSAKARRPGYTSARRTRPVARRPNPSRSGFRPTAPPSVA